MSGWYCTECQRWVGMDTAGPGHSHTTFTVTNGTVSAFGRPILYDGEEERLAAALAQARRMQFSCTVLHADQYGNPMPCPDAPLNEARAIIERLREDRLREGR